MKKRKRFSFKKFVKLLFGSFLFNSSANQNNMSSKNIYSSIPELIRREGKLVTIEGYFSELETSRNTFQVLKLEKGKVLVLGHFKNKQLTERINISELLGKKVIIVGRIFFKQIPPEFNIFSQIGEPYLVDIESIVKTKI